MSSVGDAENLHGGTLLATPLRPVAPVQGADVIYAVAQGAVSTGGFSAQQGGASVVKNHPTTGYVPNGAIVEREVANTFATKAEINLLLKNPDFTTAQRIAQMINATTGFAAAQPRNAATVAVQMPPGGTGERVDFIARIESLEISPDFPARVVYNERTGTIVMGANVRISTAIITHGNLIFEKQTTSAGAMSQATGPFGQQTTTLESTASQVLATEEDAKPQVLEEGVTVGEVCRGLNALGVTARDIIAILQALKQAGALQAELVAI